jgi:dipeptidyl aminopeptidase/acylaminoacyl peptidase
MAAALLSAVSISAAAGKRPITEKDLFRFTWIADPQISPDGARVAFVRVTVNENEDRYDTSLWSVAAQGGEAPRRLTNGPRDTAPRWAPDGKRLAFIRASEKDGKPQPGQLYIMSMAGGEPKAITSLPKGADSPAWSPDGTMIVFTSRTAAEDLAKAERKKKSEENRQAETAPDGKPTERESDVRVITRAVYRFNGQGYLDAKRRSHLWVVRLAESTDETPNPKQLTYGDFDEQDPTWAPDGTAVYFTSNRTVEPYYEPPRSDLYSVPAVGGEIRKIASIDGTISDISPSHDGKRVAFCGVITRPIRSYNRPDLFITDTRAPSTPRNLTTSYDFDIGSGLTGDQHAPRGGRFSTPIWTRDGRSLLVVAAEKGRADLKRVDTTSAKVEPFTSGEHEVIAYSATPDGSRITALVSTPTSIGDLFIVDGSNGAMTQVTRLNEKLFSEINVTPPEEFWYSSFDGKRIQAWVQKPPDFDASKKYPLILNIHGGPHAAYGYTFDHEFQWMAAKGYVVLYPNPRGSTSYGAEFANVIQYHYPGDDYKDLMAGVDEVIKRGYIDPRKLGVTGGSGGGLLTNWVITQTDRFAAAVSQRSIADWAGFWYTADFTLFNPSWFRAAPWQDPADFAARSPITHIEKVKTPLMLIEGEADYRTPPGSGGEQMFRALKYLHRPVVMVRFPEESHELSRSGKPWHRVERLEHIVNWFDKYLQGRELDIYDIPGAKVVAGASKE